MVDEQFFELDASFHRTSCLATEPVGPHTVALPVLTTIGGRPYKKRKEKLARSERRSFFTPKTGTEAEQENGEHGGGCDESRKAEGTGDF